MEKMPDHITDGPFGFDPEAEAEYYAWIYEEETEDEEEDT